MRPEPEIIARFLAKVRVDDWGCWVWEGARSRGDGNKEWYGSFGVGDDIVVRAHIFSHDTFKGKPPKGWHRDHRCRDHGAPRDNSLCVNPRHLVAVSPVRNNLRRWRRDENAHLHLSGHVVEFSGWPGCGGHFGEMLFGSELVEWRVHILAGDLKCLS
jgi:hypothetical protein